jgi:hypothetical protein
MWWHAASSIVRFVLELDLVSPEIQKPIGPVRRKKTIPDEEIRGLGDRLVIGIDDCAGRVVSCVARVSPV